MNGTLNGYKNGQIGGNIVFSDSYGFIVGKSGQVNVGSLTVNTPTREFLETVIDRAGNVDPAAAARLIKSDVPLSRDGAIVINGRINARNAIRLHATDVSITGEAGAPARHRARFEATVNTKGLVQGTTAVVRGGSIEIVAAGSAKVAGRVIATGNSRQGGTVAIKAAQDLQIARTAQIYALAMRQARADAAMRAQREAARSRTPESWPAGWVKAPGTYASGGSVKLEAGRDLDIQGRVRAQSAAAGIMSESANVPRAAGQVVLSAGRDASVSGTVSADGQAGRDAGSIEFRAGGDIALLATSKLSAAGRGEGSSGGRIVVFADGNTTVADNASVAVGANIRGDGGFAELSARNTVTLGALKLDLVGARGGTDGTLLVDPADIVIGSGIGTNQASYFTGGGNVDLQASSSITLATSGVIDTRHYDGTGTYSVGNSGSVTLDAPTITIRAGSSIRADIATAAGHDGTGLTGGAVSLKTESGSPRTSSITVEGGAADVSGGTLGANIRGGSISIIASAGSPDFDLAKASTATVTIGRNAILTSAGTIDIKALSNTQTGPDFKASSTATIDLAGTLRGTAITIESNGTARSDFLTTSGILTTVASSFLSTLLGINGAYVGADLTSRVSVSDGASITGTGTVSIQSFGKATASAIVPVVVNNSLFAVGVVVGEVNTHVTSEVAKGATLSSGGQLLVRASGDNTLNVTTLAFSTGTTPVAANVAVGLADVNATAVINSGATISAAGSLTVLAQNKNAFAVSSGATAANQGVFAVGIAYSDTSSTTTARLGADVAAPTGNAPYRVGSVAVLADSNTVQLANSASATVGDGALGAVINPVLSALTYPAGKIKDLIGGAAKGFDSGTDSAKGAIGLGIASGSQTATASISGDDGTAPSVTVGGNVVVAANAVIARGATDPGLRSNAQAGIENADAIPIQGDQATVTTVGISLSTAVDNISNTASAFIAPNAVVAGQFVAVRAETEVPIRNIWLTYDSPSAILGKLNANLGVGNQILTSFSRAQSAADDVGFAGTVNYLSISNNTTAWVGSGAQVTARGTLNAGSTWSKTPDPSFNVPAMTFDGAVVVRALNTTETIDVAGDFGIKLVGGVASGNDGKSIGGSAVVGLFNSNTVAGIATGAVVSAENGSVVVDARGSDTVFSIAPTSGAGDGAAVKGIVGVTIISNHVSASISKDAQVTANQINVIAEQAVSLVTAAGSFGYSKNAALGVALTYAQVGTDTRAFVGDNSGETARTGQASIDDGSGAPSAASLATFGLLKATALDVEATTAGRVVNVAVTGEAAVNDGVPRPPKIKAVKDDRSTADKVLAVLSSVGTGVVGIPAAIAEAVRPLSAIENLAEAAQQAKKNITKDSTTEPSISIAGSAAVDVSNMDTQAYVQGARIQDRTGAGSVDTSVTALNNVLMATASGSAALSMTGSSATSSAALAGAVAVSLNANDTKAFINATTITRAGDVRVQSLAAGQEITIGLALSGESSGSPNSGTFSASVSLTQVFDSSQAYISGSTFTGTGSGAAVVGAYRSTDIGAGGGSLYLGGRGGLGFALTYAEIGNPSGQTGACAGSATCAQIINSSMVGAPTATDAAFASLDVGARDVGRIIAASAVIGGGANQNGLGGAIVVAKITNDSVAGISADPSAGDDSRRIRVSGAVNITSATAPDSDLAAKVASVTTGRTTDGNAPVDVSGTDFSGSAVQANAKPGASIISVAGVVQVGKSNFGFSLLDNEISQTHSATIGTGVLLSTAGDVTVQGSSDASIIGVAIGVGVASGQAAGVGSVVINQISNTISATIGGDVATTTNTSVSGRDVVVQALDGSNIRGAAGAIAFAVSGSAAVGLSVVYDSIGNGVSASVSGADINASRDVTLKADSSSDILTLALGVAVSKGAGVAGSVATSLERTNVTAQISNGADVDAQNNVAVIGSNASTIAVIAGAAGVTIGSGAGVGLSLVVNDITGDTKALISGASTKVDARGQGTGAVTINTGTLANEVALNLTPTLSFPNLTETTRDVHGLAVSATSHQSVITNAMSLGLAFNPTSTGVAITPVVNTVRGHTVAGIDDASIDTRLDLAATVRPDLAVAAGSHSTANNFVVSGATGGFGGSGTSITNVMSRTSDAHIAGATVGRGDGAHAAVDATFVPDGGSNLDGPTGTYTAGSAAIPVRSALNAISVNAASSQTASDLAIAASAGGIAVGGSLAVNTFSATTSATVDRGSLVASSLDVEATGRNAHIGAVASYADGAGNGVSGSFSVNLTSGTTQASIGNSSTTTKIALLDDLTVKATSNDTFKSYVIGAAFGGGNGVAAMANVDIVQSTTHAFMDHVSMNQTVANGGTVDIGQSGNVALSATQTVTISPTVGSAGVGLGGVGVGAGANVVLLKGSITSEILNSDLNSSGDVSSAASGTKDVTTMTITAGVGTSAGIGAAVAVVIAGTATPEGALNELDKKDDQGNNSGTLTQVNATSNASPQSDLVSSSTPGAPTTSAPSQNVVRDAVASTAQDGVYSKINGGTVTAGSVTVTADGAVGVKSAVYGVGAGGVGVGAAVGYTRVYDTVTASVDGGTINTGALTVTATMADKTGRTASEVKSYAGAGGLAAAVGAAVADTGLQNTVSATVGGTVTGGASSSALVSATDTTSASTYAFGATVGGGAALGVSVATTLKTSLVASTLTSTANVSGFNGLSVTANGSGPVSAYAIAGAGGIGLAAVGASANAIDNATVIAEAGRTALNAKLGTAAPTSAPTVSVGAGGFGITATATPDVAANSVGVAVAGSVALGASVSLATASPHVIAQLDNNGRITSDGGLTIGASIAVPSDGTSVSTNAAGGSGGILVGATAVDSESKNTGTALARLGDNIVLPLGAVSVTSDNQTNQDSISTGVAAGWLSIGIAIAKSTSDTSSKVEIGNSVIVPTMSVNGVTVPILRLTSFIADANGTNTNTSRGVAGSGGVYAGAGATGDTSDTSTVMTTIGTGSVITASTIGISAEHTSQWNASSNSVSAAALNASASLSGVVIHSTVKVAIGANTTLDANAYGLTNCGTTACVPALSIVADNEFKRVGSYDGAEGGAGGVLTGAASGTTTSINRSAADETRIDIGAGVALTSGTDAVTAPGSIVVLAKSNLSGTDSAKLTTGGLIQGAGVSATGRATLNNNVAVGAGATIWTAGSVDIATVTTTNFGQSGDVATYGLAAVGITSATAEVETNQSVTFADSTAAAKTTVVGLYNVNLTPGRFVGGGLNTSIKADASAQGEVRGLIAVPHADATAHITSNASLTIGANVDVKSAQNATLGGYTGDTNATADGTGHGYILGFIPATSSNSSQPVDKSSTVTINGTVAAGVFNNQQITIDQVNGQYVVNKTLKQDPTCLTSCTLGTTLSLAGTMYRIQQAAGAPVDLYLDNAFNPQAFIQARITNTDIGSVKSRENALAGVSGGTVTAVRITSGLYAAGGLVTLNADALAGSGTVTANGGPQIRVVNNTTAYLAVEGGAFIPDTPGGSVIFTGAAGLAQKGSLSIVQNGAGASPTILINNAYPDAIPGSTLGPALFAVGPVSVAGGLLDIRNAAGSYLGLGTITGQTQLFTVPNGTFTVDATGAGQFYGADTAAAWKNALIFPGGNPRSGAPNAEAAIDYVANAIFTRGSYTSQLGYSRSLNFYDPNSSDRINQAFYGNSGLTDGHALVLHGNFLPFGGGSGNVGGSGSSGDYRLTVDSNGSSAYFQKFPYLSLSQNLTTTPSSTTFSSATATPSIIGNKVVINASTIDINGRISIGQVTDYNVNLTSAIGQSIRDYQSNFDNPNPTGTIRIFGVNITYPIARNTNPTFDLTPYLAPSLNGKVTASYDTTTHLISVSKIESYSGGASLFLNGAVVNSNPNAMAGQILVNGGFGNVAVTNATGYAVSLAGINTGDSATAAASVAQVQIRNTLITSGPDTTTYIYSPGAGVTTYYTYGGADPAAGATGSLQASQSVTYNPVSGSRLEWALQAELTRPSLFNPYNRGTNAYPSWVFTNANDPWRYVDPNSSSSSFNYSSQTTSFERAVVRSGVAGLALTQTITGDTRYGGTGYYQTLNHDAQNARGFVRQARYSNLGHYEYDVPGSAYLRMNMSAKADYGINIQFTGNATGTVNIASNASVNLAGKIINPSGPTSITTTAGDITQTAAGGIVTKSLTLNAAGSIGTPQQAVFADLVGTANLTALASSAGINLVVGNVGATVGQISSRKGNTFGDVKVVASGSLVAGTAPFGGLTPGANVVGRNIQLTSTNGSVGTGSAPLILSANGTGDANGGLGVFAQTQIGLTQQAGDLRIGRIESVGGDIAIIVPTGRLLDARNQLSSQVLSPDQVAKVSASLRLTDADGAQTAIAETITGFEILVNRSLTDYDALLGRGAVAAGAAPVDPAILALYQPLASADKIGQARTTYRGAGSDFVQPSSSDLAAYANGLVQANGVFTLNTAESIDHYRPAAAAALGATTATDTQVQAWANAQYQGYTATFARAYGTDWRLSVDTANRTAFTVAPNSALRTALSMDATWNTTQLVQAVDRSALQPGQGTVGSLGNPNIVGRNVTLSVGQGIGKLAPPIDILVTDLRDGVLNDAQRGALVTATTPGSVTLLGTTTGGAALADGTTLANLPTGATITALRLTQIAPLYVKASGNLLVSSGDVIYLQGTGDASLNLDTVTAAGAVKLLTPGSITAARTTGTTPNIVANGNIDLIADAGSIGTSTAPVRYQAGSGFLNSASAGTDAYLTTAENMRLGRVFAGGTAGLTSTGGYILGMLPGITVNGSSIVLDAASYIGTASNRFTVTVSDSGSLIGIARSGEAYLRGTGPTDRPLAALGVGNFSTVKELDILADNDLSISGTVSASSTTNGTIKLRSKSLTMTATGVADARRTIDALADNNVVLGSLKTTDGVTIPAEAIRVISTFGSIQSAGDSLLNINAGDGRSEVVMSAATGIGTAARPITIKAATLTADTLNSDMVLTARSALYSPSLRATTGAITLRGDSDLDLAYLVAGYQINEYNNGKLNVGTALSTGQQTYSALNAVTYGTLVTTSGSGNVSVQSRTGTVAGTTINAKGTATVDGAGVTLGTVTSGGQATLTSSAGLTGTSVASQSGIKMRSVALIDWQALSATGAVDLAASAGSIRLGSSTTGIQAGSALIVAAQDLTGTTLTTSQSGATLTSTSGNQSWSNLNILGALVEKSGGTTTIDRITTRGATSTDSGGNQSLNVVSSSAAFTAKSGGTLSINQATSVGTQTITSAGLFTFGNLTSTDLNSDIGVTVSNSNVAGGIVSSQRNATIQGVGVTLTSLTTKAQATVTATGGLAADATLGYLTGGSLNAGTGILARSAGLMTFTDVVAGASADFASSKGSVRMTSLRAGDAKVVAAQDLTATSTLTSTRTAILTATAGKLDWTADMNVGTTFSATSGTTLALGRVTAVSGVTTNSGGSQTLGVVSAGSALTATSRAGLSLTSASSTGTQRLTSAGPMTFGQLTTTALGGDIILTSGVGSMTGTAVNARGNATLSGAGIAVDGVTAGSQVSITSTAGASGRTISAGTGLTLRTTGLVDYADIGATGAASIISDLNSIRLGGLRAQDATVTANQDLTGTGALTTTRAATLTATNGALSWQGDESIATTLSTRSGRTAALGKVTAGGTVTTVSGGAQTLSTINATGALTVTAVGGVTATTLTSAAKVQVTSTGAGNVGITTISGSDVWLDSGSLLAVNMINVRNTLKLGGSDIRIGTVQQMADAFSALQMDVTGSAGGTANYASVNILTSKGVKTGTVKVIDLRMTVNGTAVTVAR